MSDTAVVKLAKPVTVLVDLRVVLEGRVPTYRDESMERYGVRLDAWARELEEFIRDHRSQDNVSITVERVRETVCDQCQRSWETYAEAGETHCASCGVTASPSTPKAPR